VTLAAWDKGLAAVAAQVEELEALQAARASHPQLELARQRMAVATAETALRRTLARIDAAAAGEDPTRPFEQALLRLGAAHAAAVRKVVAVQSRCRLRSLWLDLLVAGHSGAALGARLVTLEATEKHLKARLRALRAERSELRVATENQKAVSTKARPGATRAGPTV
jgi:hypothetical protein